MDILLNSDLPATEIKSIKRHDFHNLNKLALQYDYIEDGCVIIENIVEPDFIAEMHDRLIVLFTEIICAERLDFNNTDNLDILHQRILQISSERAESLLGIGRDFPAFFKLISSPNIMTLIQALFETKEIQMVFDTCAMRIDRPYFDRTNLDWHQDYPYNMQAVNTATAWIPLLPVTETMGSLKVILGSNKHILPIVYRTETKKQHFNAKYIEIAHINQLRDQFEADGVVVPTIQPGSLILLHALTIHRSGQNHSDRSRWVALSRYSPFMDSAVYKRNWFTSRSKYPDIFRNYHPDLFSESSE